MVGGYSPCVLALSGRALQWFITCGYSRLFPKDLFVAKMTVPSPRNTGCYNNLRDMSSTQQQKY